MSTAEGEGFGAWVQDVYEPAVSIIGAVFKEATGCTDEQSYHLATAVMARLVDHDPPLTVMALKSDVREP
jgi:hypothetical protein